MEFSDENIVKEEFCDSSTALETVVRNFLNHSNSGFAFEMFGVNVLRDYLKKQGKGMIEPSEYSRFDAFLPDGIDDVNLPTDLEVKYMKTNRSGYWRAVERLCIKLKDSKVEHLLIILGTDFTEKTKEMLKNHPQKFTSIPVTIWDINDFKEKTEEFWKDHIQYLALPQKAIVEKAIFQNKTAEELAVQQKNIFAQLKQKYQDEELVLVIGAGVSIDANVPLWDDLIKRLLIEMINIKLKTKKNEFTKEQVNQLVQLAYTNMEDSPLAQMRYIKKAFNNKDFMKLIRSVLYEKKPIISTELLKSVSRICTPRRRHLGVKSIITYNFDDLIEKSLTSKGIEHVSIARESDISDVDGLNIYHVHGYLPQNSLEIEEDVNIVFSEEDYHKVYRDAYCWSNLIQLNSFRESTCLFIGCSLNDPNLRRLLDVAARRDEEPRHYAIMKRKRMQKEIDSSVFEAYENIDNSIRESYFNSLGIKILWVDKYEEIPNILLELL